MLDDPATVVMAVDLGVARAPLAQEHGASSLRRAGGRPFETTVAQEERKRHAALAIDGSDREASSAAAWGVAQAMLEVSSGRGTAARMKSGMQGKK
jgi:hypothetical protein